MTLPSRPRVTSRWESCLSFSVFPGKGPSNIQNPIFSQATGFLWERNKKLFLVTNLHNLTGWDYSRSKAMSPSGWLPEWIAARFTVAFDICENSLRLKHQTLEIKLFDRDGNPEWIIHPTYGNKVDVGIIDLGKLDFIGELYNIAVNTHTEWTRFSPTVADDAYVVGFPKGMDGGKGFPVWKRASIASEPVFDLNDLPLIYVDTATREGMSGSPVLVMRRGFTMPDEAKDFGEASLGESIAFLGVYSGRVGDDPLGIQLGMVWKAKVIDEIIDGNVRGCSPI